MNCPKCGVAIKESSKVCFNCGEDLEKYSIDQLIQTMLNEDEDKLQPKAKASKKKEAKKNNSEQDKHPYSMGMLITKGINILIIVLLIGSLFLPWFVFEGEGFAKGYISQGRESAETLDTSIEFSAFELRQYAKNYGDYYNVFNKGTEEEKHVWSSQLQLYYLHGILGIILLGGLSIILIALDRKMKTGEWVRGFSVISALIIGLIYSTFKIPFFSMFTTRAQNILRSEDMLSAVKMNLDGIQVNDQFYAYMMTEQIGFYIAAVVCGLWFVFSTIMIEMREGKEE
ncbi:zinc ribbon domain-containing protein [Vallitaleaceae bacterium 9-2]